jgi:hypothetical protein
MRRVAALLVTSLLAGCSPAGSGPSAPPERVVEPAQVPAGLESGCPDPVSDLRLPEGDLPTGATKVRLCPGPPQLDGQGDQLEPGIQAVPELLTTDVDVLVAAVNDEEDLTEDVECTFDGGPDVTYWFGYPDGDWRAVRLGAYGCHQLTVGIGRVRLGGTELATTFVEALTSQRRASTPPDVRTPATCGAFFGTTSPSPLPGRPIELATAVLCRPAGAYRYRQADVTASLLARINDELLAGPTQRTGRCVGASWRSVEGYSVWGDRHTYVIDGCGGVQAPFGEGLHLAGQEPASDPTYLNPGLAAAIDRQHYGPVVDSRDE